MFGRFEMQCLYVTRTMTECPLRGSRCPLMKGEGGLKMLCLCLAGAMIECPYMRGVHLPARRYPLLEV